MNPITPNTSTGQPTHIEPKITADDAPNKITTANGKTISTAVFKQGHLSGSAVTLKCPAKNKPPPLTAAPQSTLSAANMSKEARETLAADAEIAAYPYHQSLNKLKGNNSTRSKWSLASPLAQKAGKSLGLSTKEAKGFIYDKKSGLTAYILQNSSTNEIRLIFGGTSSGKHAGGMARRSLLNGPFALKQWAANLINVRGNKIPKSYKQAASLTKTVQAMVESDPAYTGFKLKVSGHSKGAGEASYSTMTLEKPVEAICFSSAQLGSQLRAQIPENNKKNASKFISHFAIKGDPVPRMNHLAKHLGHLGTLTIIPPKSAMSTFIDRHDQFGKHIRHFANKASAPPS